jgi:hypothetical protein
MGVGSGTRQGGLIIARGINIIPVWLRLLLTNRRFINRMTLELKPKQRNYICAQHVFQAIILFRSIRIQAAGNTSLKIPLWAGIPKQLF